ncbi:MAG: type I DNA topoisomerase [Proteobacteria bacterium]|nr:type I DNA topoisomerase [Pseudomonadota bacterium]
MRVVIVESPAKSKTINKYLGSDYKVLASFGHVRDLPSADGSVEPDKDFLMHYEVPDDASKNMKAIADAVKKADSLILATDPDREGEAISWHLVEALREKKALPKDIKIERVVFNSITRTAVEAAMAAPRAIDMDLVNAQQARRALDYLVGFNLSPVLWRKLPGSRSAGRVQSVALRLICDREEEIEKFIAEEYWDIKVALEKSSKEHFTARLTHVNGEKLEKFSLNNEAKAEAVATALRSASYKVASVEKKQARRNPYAPFTTSTLQQEAFRKLGFGAKRTMQLAQRLYEGVEIGKETVGLITYMRTDGVEVAPEAVMATRDLIEKRFGTSFVPKSPRMYQSKAANAQEAHEAIRPTDVRRDPASVAKYLDEDQRALYDLIWKRMVASQMESAVLDVVSVDIAADKNMLRASGSTIKFPGFFSLYNEDRDDPDDDDDEGRILPPLNEGEPLKQMEVTPAQHFTEPPPRFSEASLVKRMEELGIGRPSTYASIIAVLQDREYVKLDKKRFVPEPRGRVVTSFLAKFFTKYVEYDFTANLEEDLDRISAGEADWKQVLRAFWGDFSNNVAGAKDLKITDVIDALNQTLADFLFPGKGSLEERRKCPTCGEGVLGLKVGKFGAFIGCSNYPECRYTRQLDVEIGNKNEDGTPVQNVGGSYPRVLGNHPDGQEVSVRQGPYGFYVQLGEEKKPKRAPLLKHLKPDTVTLEEALSLLQLPREVGLHPETGEMIKAGVGRFGPYLFHDGKYTSIKAGDDVLTIGINRAVTVIAEAAARAGARGAKGGRGSAAPLKILGKHPDSGEDIGLYSGKYGPYVKHGKTNATLPKDASTETFTLEEAIALIQAKEGGGKKKPARKASAKKTTRKKKNPDSDA